MKAEIARILKQEGYIADYDVETDGKFPEIQVTNKYVNRTRQSPVLKRVSKPGLRKYVGAGEIPRVLGGMGIAIFRLLKGIVTGREAKRARMLAANCSPWFGNESSEGRRRCPVLVKKPIELPDKVKLRISSEGMVEAEGPKGKLEWTLPRESQGVGRGQHRHLRA